jgi:hypothetical protein
MFEKSNEHGRKHRYQPGQSGNPGGTPKSRVEFEREFYNALLTRGSPEKAADMLWTAAEAGESWAILALLQRLAPETPALRLAVDPADGLDFSAFTDEELEWFSRIVERVRGAQPAGLLEAPAEPAEKEPFK